MASIKILALPGSLRKNSSSNVVLNALQSSAKADTSFSIYNGIGKLLCTPEYAFGVPGSLKNALDWTVSSGEFVSKPVALVTASSNGEYGHAALLLILRAISAKVPDEATLLISFVRSKINKQGEVTDPVVKNQLKNVLDALIKTVHND
jgi:chromate reductase, NAD(P)H dehydrogenase (quinone)